MTPRQIYWLLCIVADTFVVVACPHQPLWFYVLTGVLIAVAASGLAGY